MGGLPATGNGTQDPACDPGRESTKNEGFRHRASSQPGAYRTPADGGANQPFIPHYENYKLLKWAGSLWYSPGVEIENEFDLIHHDGSIKRVRCWGLYHPTLRVCIARGYHDVVT